MSKGGIMEWESMQLASPQAGRQWAVYPVKCEARAHFSGVGNRQFTSQN